MGCSGGFAGDSVVPPEYRMDKFSSKETCPTFNFNGDVKGALLALSTHQIQNRILVSKNVCHSIVYDQEVHQRYEQIKNKNSGTVLIYHVMSKYLEKHQQKALHDPLAACVSLNPDICQFREVEVYRSKGEWGSRLLEGSNTKISISVDKDKFFHEFMMGSV